MNLGFLIFEFHAELLSKYDDILERLIKLENGAAVNPVTKPDDPKPAEMVSTSSLCSRATSKDDFNA